MSRFFSHKYCDLLSHASFTKFLNNNTFYFQKKKKCEFWDFFWWWSLQRGQLNKSPCVCQKNVTKSERKKLLNSIKLDPLSCPLIPVIFIKRYTKKLSNSWIYLWKNFLDIHWRCLQNIVLQNPKKHSPFLQNIYPREFSFHTIHLYNKIHLVYSLKIEHFLNLFRN